MVLAVSGGTLQAARDALAADAEPERTPEPVSATLAVIEQPAPPPAPPVERPAVEDLEPGAQVPATVSYYYCQQGTDARGIGDGGGFCGHMRDGTVVYAGAAACDTAYLGQHFRIIGDPLDRVYTCADTGSAVHGQHRDIWFLNSDQGMAWQAVLGRNITIEILE
jgi:3D (Asp-Asp-Asp) domain-containing protein